MLLSFLVAVDRNLESAYLNVIMLKKASKDFGCKLFTIIMHDFLGLTVYHHNPLFKYI